MSEAPYGRVFTIPEALPRGPHRLSREAVAASQRTRLMAAIAEIVAERGYAAATIGEISTRASVSPKTFYEHFADKLECFLAAYDHLIAALFERMGADVELGTAWDQFVVNSLSAYLGTLEENPTVARAFLVEIEAAGPVARQRRRAAYRKFADLIRERHERIRHKDARLGPLPPSIYLAIVHGVRELVCDALDAEAQPRLTDLGPDMFLWISATIRGAAAAAQEVEMSPQAGRLRVT